MPAKLSAAQLIKKYIECRNSIAKLTARYDDEMAPYKDGMALLEGMLAEEINRLEGQSIKTEFGTAYRSTVTSFRVADRETWLNWVFDHNQRDMLTTHVAKDAIKDYTEAKGGTPPGLNVTTIYKINVRGSE
jgi:hypothetical protein